MNKYCKSVLLIDDNYIDNILNTKILELTNFASEIIAIQSIEDALEHISWTHKTNKSIPDFIFLDIRMPVNDGFNFIKSFELMDDEIKKHAKIIMLTSSLAKEDESKALMNSYVKKFLSKPLTFESVELLKE